MAYGKLGLTIMSSANRLPLPACGETGSERIDGAPSVELGFAAGAFEVVVDRQADADRDFRRGRGIVEPQHRAGPVRRRHRGSIDVAPRADRRLERSRAAMR